MKNNMKYDLYILNMAYDTLILRDEIDTYDQHVIKYIRKKKEKIEMLLDKEESK